MEKNEIIVLYGQDYLRMTKDLCNMADLAGDIYRKCKNRSASVVIKPNLLGPIPADEGATTHPELVEGIVLYLRENGFDHISVMESSWVGDRTEESLLVTGFKELCERLKLPFYDLQKDTGVKMDCAGMELNICKKALEAEYLINVPVLKGHCQTRMTCALKNMKGCIPNSEKRRFHRMGLHEPIGHLSAGIRPDFILVDSICGDLSFEDGGNPVQQDRLMAALDPVLCDAYGCSLIGIPLREVRYIYIAEACGVGSSDLKSAKIRVYGEKSPEAETSDDDYRSLLHIKEMAEDVDSCSACYAALIPALKRLEEEGLLQKLPGHVCIGQGYRGKSGAIGVGRCTAAFQKSLKGCPPDEESIYAFLKEICLA